MLQNAGIEIWGVSAGAEHQQSPDPFGGGGHGGHEVAQLALSRLGGAASHKIDHTAMGISTGYGVAARNHRTRRHIGLTASAAVAGVKRSRRTAFIEVDVLQLSAKFACSYTACARDYRSRIY